MVSGMDVRYINPFVAAVQAVFETMLETPVLVSRPRLLSPDDDADLAALIGFAGDATGSVALCFTKRSGVSIAGKFAGIEVAPEGPEIADALGELANMVAGQAKAQLTGCNVSISLPQVIAGRHHEVLQGRRPPVLVLPCDSKLGRFAVEVAMSLRGQPQPA